MHYPNLAGIKDSNGPSPDEYAEFVAAFPELNMRTGTENNLIYALEHGMGAICMDGNVYTRAARRTCSRRSVPARTITRRIRTIVAMTKMMTS